MALSNIFREPRREIVETLVGVGSFAAFLCPDYWFASWLKAASTSLPHDHGIPIPIPIGMAIGIAAMLLIGVVLLMIHLVGEEVCDFLARRGLHLRPTQRY